MGTRSLQGQDGAGCSVRYNFTVGSTLYSTWSSKQYSEYSESVIFCSVSFGAHIVAKDG